jgi:thiamine pyrophosphokinase
LLAIIVADGEIRGGHAMRRALQEDPSGASSDSPILVVAADGGALLAEAIGLRPDLVVGDGDSLPVDRAGELRSAGVEVITHPVSKNESDTQLAVGEALARGATSLVVIGALGGARLEHSIANLLLLTLPELADLDVALVDGPSTVRVIGVSGSGELRLRGSVGDYVSLLPLSEAVVGVTTTGLRFPLNLETLNQGPARGLSNEFLGTEASVTTRSGRLAVVHTVRTEVETDG